MRYDPYIFAVNADKLDVRHYMPNPASQFLKKYANNSTFIVDAMLKMVYL